MKKEYNSIEQIKSKISKLPRHGEAEIADFDIIDANNYYLSLEEVEGIIEAELTMQNKINELKAAIRNEDIWMKGSSTEEQEIMHIQNINNLTAQLSKLYEERSKE